MPRTCAPPSGSNFCSFVCSFFGKIGQNNRLAPPLLRLALPPLGNPGSATDSECGRMSVEHQKTVNDCECFILWVGERAYSYNAHRSERVT